MTEALTATNPTPIGLEAVFIINLVQDVNILRPLAIMAARDMGWSVKFLVSSRFAGRDVTGIWRAELGLLSEQVNGALFYFESELHALPHLAGTGLLFSSSESHLPGHATAHDVMRVAPRSFLRVSLQHGFECVGFRHSAAHDDAHGPDASFAADIVCAWFAPEHLTGMAASQRPKVMVTGPTTVLQQFTGAFPRNRDAPGMVCENLHSVRLKTHAGVQNEFVDVFTDFCAEQASSAPAGQVVLRPHPGGQYTLRNKLPLPPNASIINNAMFRTDMRQFAYGISAPSSVILDMVLAGIPTAVWIDGGGHVDNGNYCDLPTVATAADWTEFAYRARMEPDMFAEGQRRFLQRLGLIVDPADVYARYAALFDLAADNISVLRAATLTSGIAMSLPGPAAD